MSDRDNSQVNLNIAAGFTENFLCQIVCFLLTQKPVSIRNFSISHRKLTHKTRDRNLCQALYHTDMLTHKFSHRAAVKRLIIFN